MFIQFLFIPHLEDTYLDLGPDIVALCNREFTLAVNTNSSNVIYEQITGDPITLDVTNPFNPIINIEQVTGRFTLKAYGDDEVTDTVVILSGPIDTTLPIEKTTKVGLPPVNVSIVGIYTQRVNEFFRWRDSVAKIKWGDINFLPNNVISIKAYKLLDNQVINESSLNNIITISSENAFGLEVQYDIGGNKSSRSGGNWFFNNNAQTDERYELNYGNVTYGNNSRIIYVKNLFTYIDSLNIIRHSNKSSFSRSVYSMKLTSYIDSLNDTKVNTKSNFLRTIYTDRIIA